MSMKEFWEENPDLFWAYRFSFYNKTKRDEELFNYNAWLQGMYFYEAVSVALCNGFSKQKASYSTKPYEFGSNKEKSFEKEQQKAVEDMKARVAKVQSIMDGKEKDVLIGGEKR